MRWLISLLLLSAAWADHLVLQDGRVIEGVVSVAGDSLILRGLGWRRGFHRHQVRGVSYAPTADELLGHKLQAVDVEDPERLRALAAWADQHGSGRAEELRLWALALELELRIRAASSLEDYLALALWAREAGCSSATVALCDGFVLERDPDCFALRALRGEVFCGGRWMSAAEADAHTAAELRRLRGNEGADAAKLLELLEEASRDSAPDTRLLHSLQIELPPPGSLRPGWISQRLHSRRAERLLQRILERPGRAGARPRR